MLMHIFPLKTFCHAVTAVVMGKSGCLCLSVHLVKTELSLDKQQTHYHHQKLLYLAYAMLISKFYYYYYYIIIIIIIIGSPVHLQSHCQN